MALKILHFGCGYHPYRGGSSSRLEKLSLSSAMSENHSLYLITHQLSDNEKKDNVPFLEVLRQSSANSLKFKSSIYEFLKRISPDVVILHNSRVLLSWFINYRRFFKRTKIVLEVHSIRDDRWYEKHLNRLLYRRCSSVVVLSESCEKYIQAKYGVGRTHVIYNGINKQRLSNNVDARVYNPNAIRVSYIGSFYRWQGVYTIVNIVNALGLDYWLTNTLNLVGGGPEFATAIKLIDSEILDQGNINIEGWVNEKRVNEIYANTDYLLALRPSTSATETVVPLKVLESIQYRIPLIATNVGGLKELLSDKGFDYGVFVGKESEAVEFFRSPLSLEDYISVTSRLGEREVELDSWEDSGRKYARLLELL